MSNEHCNHRHSRTDMEDRNGCHIYNTDVYPDHNIADYIIRTCEMAGYLYHHSYICSYSIVDRSKLCIK